MESSPPRRSASIARAAVLLTALATLIVLGVAAAGPSAAEPGLGPRHGWRGVLPAYSLHLHPSSALVAILLDAAYLLGGLGVALGLLAVQRGHRLPVRQAWLVGAALAVAAVLVPPMGSADHVNYAAYGRIAAQGGDPYVVPPISWHGGHDPVTGAVEPPWQTTPSIYGPVATAIEAGTSLIGGSSLRATVWTWQLVCLAAWLVIGALVLRVARAGEGGRDGPAVSRALWLWMLNPVLYGVVLIGAHVDVLATAFGLVALILAARQPFWAGVALGAAAGTKLTLLLAVPAVLWGVRHLGRRRLTGHIVWGTLGAAVVLMPAHLWAGPHVFDQLRRARRFVSLATPWRPPVGWLTGPISNASVRDGVAWLTPVAVLLVAIALWVITRPRAPTTRAPARPDLAVVSDGARALVVLGAAYSLAAPYSLPWYDALAWAPLAIVAAGPLDAVLLVRLVAYAVAYVPGRVIGMTARVQEVTLDIRRDVTPYVGWALLVAVTVLAVRARRRDRPAPDPPPALPGPPPPLPRPRPSVR